MGFFHLIRAGWANWNPAKKPPEALCLNFNKIDRHPATIPAEAACLAIWFALDQTNNAKAQLHYLVVNSRGMI